jgi:folate-binding protein YgfZ
VIAQVTVSAPVEVAKFNLRARSLDDFDGLRNNFLADSVSGDYGNTFLGRFSGVHGEKVTTTHADLLFAIIERAVKTALLQTALAAQAGPGAHPLSLMDYLGVTTAGHFGDPQAELAAMLSGCAVYDMGFRARISLTGSDRVRWLNGMVTNNIRDLSPERGVYAFLLNPQGHILGDMYAYNRGESLIVDTDRSQVDKILATFDHYIIMDDVEVNNLSEQLTAIGVTGPKARTVLIAAGITIPATQALQVFTPQCACQCDCLECTMIRAEDSPRETYEIWLAAKDVSRLWHALVAAGATPAGSEALEMRRIVAGIPLYGVDIRERDLPQETEQARALNFSKGCYIGQEIVERIRSRGSVHRSFTGFASPTSGMITRGAKVFSAEKEVGEVTSAISLHQPDADWTVALGYIRRQHAATPGKETPEVTIAGAKAQVIQLPVRDAPFLSGLEGDVAGVRTPAAS